jgi:hypothetical protein
MKPFLKILLLVCCVLNFITSYAKSLADPCSSQLFASELDAVRAAADRYNPQSIQEDREYMGAIFESEGKFGYTVAAAARRKDNWRLSMPSMEWDRVRAFWHTHGGTSSKNRYFSSADTRSAKKFGLPFYLADYTGYLKVYRAGDKTLNLIAADRLNLPRQSGFAIGEYVRDKLNRPVRVSVRESRQNLNG